MTLDNSIDNRIAGWLWIAFGVTGSLWFAARGTRISQKIGGWWNYFFGPEPSPEARHLVVGNNVRAWGFAAAWLALYLLLDWLF